MTLHRAEILEIAVGGLNRELCFQRVQELRRGLQILVGGVYRELKILVGGVNRELCF